MNFKKDFPILQNNKQIVYLDSTATTQKPFFVIDWIKNYLENNYSNIHRWMYDIAQNSEDLYNKSKQKVSDMIWANSIKEIVYTYNSTYAVNLLTQTLRFNKKLKAWDKVLLSIVEHHANIVPWLILKEEIWIEIDYIKVNENFDLDFIDFEKKYDSSVKVISITHVSNITGQIFDLESIWIKKREDTLFIIDASQSIPHFKLDVKKLNCDFLFFTWHKIMSDSWIWILWWKEKLFQELKSVFSWGWAIKWVKESCFKEASIPDKFEPGTPNLTWAVSLLKAIEYIENIWGFKKIEEIENELVEYILERFNKIDSIKLIGSKESKNRVWVFSFVIEWIHSLDIADMLAEENICIRAWQHCAEPFLISLWINHTARMSLYIYNTKEDIDKFFEVLNKTILLLK